MKFTEYLNEDKGDEAMVQKHFDKAEHDINKDADLPAKKSSPINQIQTKMGLEESLQVKTLEIKVTFNDEFKSIEDAHGAIEDAFKRYKGGSGGAKYVNIYDDENNKVGYLEVK